LAAIVEWQDQIVLARNAAWPAGRFALITGFMEAGEDPQEGIRREIFEETHLQATALSLVGVYEFIKKNQLIIAYHAKAEGQIELSPELLEYRLYKPQDIVCWPAGTGYAVADWQRGLGIEPVFKSWEERGL
jgi:NADH pyrophosphatase NudC (nudix superfamily)